MSATKIPWATDTINLVAGCSRVSPGCDHCYALRLAGRPILPEHHAMVFQRTWLKYGCPGKSWDWTGHVREIPGAVEKAEKDIASWRKPRRVFVQSMGDLFHEKVSPLLFMRVRTWAVMNPQHAFIVLTKRADNMATYCHPLFTTAEVPRNLWLGVTVENQAATERMDTLATINAPVKFISVEPMLMPIQIMQTYRAGKYEGPPDIQWCIIGAESGPGRRPCKLEWVHDLIDQCDTAGIPVFVKQLHIEKEIFSCEYRSKLSRDPADWPEWAQRQELPQ